MISVTDRRSVLGAVVAAGAAAALSSLIEVGSMRADANRVAADVMEAA